jgi:hypothetical protein
MLNNSSRAPEHIVGEKLAPGYGTGKPFPFGLPANLESCATIDFSVDDTINMIF